MYITDKDQDAYINDSYSVVIILISIIFMHLIITTIFCQLNFAIDFITKTMLKIT